MKIFTVNIQAFAVIASLSILCVLSEDIDESNPKDDLDIEVDPYHVREEGCPMVAERHNLNLTKLDGDWHLPFASLNWLADIGIALFKNSSMKLSQITGICPRITFSHGHRSSKKSTKKAEWTLKFVCPKLKGEFEMKCWLQNERSVSKFICWNDKENRDLYLMLAATDYLNWLVLVRCSPSEPDAPAEGMSWAIFSKDISMDPDVSDVLFGLLDGYGFDVDEFKTQLFYNSCEAS